MFQLSGGFQKNPKMEGGGYVMMILRIFGGSLQKTALAFALSLVLFAAFGIPAMAGELPKEGAYSITWTFSGSYDSIEVGEERVAFVSNIIIVVWNDAEEGFFHNMTGDCISMGVGEELSGYCSYRDADGDKLFENFKEEVEGKGTTTILGGTGKYAGVKVTDGEYWLTSA
jgi:hypothetical protein